MKLLPSLKQKKRYILFEIISDTTFSQTSIKKAAEQALQQFLGEYGLAKAAPLFVKQKENNKFIIKVNHNHLDSCKAAIILIKKIDNKPVVVKSVITSGTIKKASR